MELKYFAHPTAIVDSGAEVGNFTSIWHFSHVEGGARIGENCNLGQNTYVGNNGIVGHACRLGNCVSIFSHVELEDFVFCGPFMCFTHIGYPRAAINRRNVFKRTLVQRGSTLGANCTILPGVIVGEGAFIAAGAVLTKSCKPWALMVGCPAKQVGWVSAYGEKISLGLLGSGNWVCPKTGDKYYLDGGDLVRVPGGIDILGYVLGERLSRTIG